MSAKLRAAAASGVAAVLLSLCARMDGQEGIKGVATDLGNRFINLNTPLVNDAGTFEAIITHRFNQAVIDAGGSNLWGLDGSAEIGLGVEYVPIKNVAVQVYRARSHADYEFAAKIGLLAPRKDLPIAVAVRGGLNWLTASDLEDLGLQKQTSGFGQLLVSGTLFDRVTLSVAPTYVQRTPVQKDFMNFPVMARIKITKSIALVGEFVPKRNVDLKEQVFTPDGIVFNDVPATYQWSVLLEKSVFHHRFGLYIGNTLASTMDQLMGSDFGAVPALDNNGNKILIGGVTDRNIHFGFNIVRDFDFPPK